MVVLGLEGRRRGWQPVASGHGSVLETEKLQRITHLDLLGLAAGRGLRTALQIEKSAVAE